MAVKIYDEFYRPAPAKPRRAQVTPTSAVRPSAAPTAPAPAIPPEAQRLQDLSLEAIASQRQSLEQDLARQMAQIGEMERFRTEETQRRVGQIEEDRPEQLGRIGSAFAARGAFSSGAREQSQEDLVQDITRQIESIRAQAKEQEKRTQFEREELKIAADRGFEELKRKQEAQQIQWTLEKRAVAEARARGGGGAGAIDPDKYRSEATSYLTARTNQLRAGGLSLAGAQSQAFQEAKTRYPHLDETWLYRYQEPAKPEFSFVKGYNISGGRGGAISSGKQTELRQKPLYGQFFTDARTYFRASPQASDEDFLRWLSGRSSAAKQLIPVNPMLLSVVLRDVRR